MPFVVYEQENEGANRSPVPFADYGQDSPALVVAAALAIPVARFEQLRFDSRPCTLRMKSATPLYLDTKRVPLMPHTNKSLLLFFCLNISFSLQAQSQLPARAAPAKVVIFCAPAVEATTRGHLQNAWLAAVMSRYLPRRLEPIEGIAVLEPRDLGESGGLFSGFGQNYDESRLFDAAISHGATHAIVHTYDFEGKEKRLTCLLEVLNLADRTVVYTIDESFPIARAGAVLDKHIFDIMNVLNVSVDPTTQKSLKRNLIAATGKTLKALGQAIESTRTNEDTAKVLDKFRKVCRKDERLSLAYLEAGTLALNSRNYAEAAQFFYHVVTRNGLSYPALYVACCTSFMKAGNPDMAERILDFAREAGWDTPELAVERARVYEADNDQDRALPAYRTVLGLLPNNPFALAYLARYCNSDGKPDSALLLSDRLVGQSGFAGPAALERGKALYAKGDFARAAKSLEQAATLLPDAPLPHLYLASIYDKDGQFDQAAKSYEKALVTMPNDIDVLLKTTTALKRSGQPEHALEILKKSASQFYNTKTVTIETGLLEFALGDTASARLHLETCIHSTPPDGRVLLTMGAIYAAAGETDKALAVYDKAIAVVPDADGAQVALAGLYLAKGQADRAAQILAQVKPTEPPQRNLCRLLGDIAFLRGELDRADNYYVKERTTHGVTTHLQKRIAVIAFKKGDLSRAQLESDKLIESAPSDPAGYYQRAIIAMRRKQINDVTTYLAQAELLGEPDSGVYSELGSGFAAAGNYDRAIDAYRKEIKTFSGNQDALKGLAEAYLKTGNDTLAAKTFVRLYETDSRQHSHSLALAGDLYYKKGNLSRAEAIYLRFIKNGHSDDTVRVHAARIAFDRGDFAAALALLEPLKPSLNSTSAVIRIAAFSYGALKQYDKALPFVRKLAAANTRSRDITELAALTYDAAGRLQSACKMYSRYLAFGKTDKSADYAFRLAELYEKRNLGKYALPQYQKNIVAYPHDFRNYTQLSRIYLARKQSTKAAQVLIKAATMKSVPPELLLELAHLERKRGKKASSEKAYLTYLSRLPNDSSAWHELARLYYTSKRYRRAIHPLSESARLMPERVEIWYELGDACIRADSTALAAAPLQRALKKDPENIRVANRLQDCYQMLADTTRLISIVETRTNLEPDNFDLVKQLGELYLATGQVDRGITVLENASRLKPSDTGIHIALANLYRAKNDAPRRLAHLDAALGYAPRNVSLHFEKAQFLLESGRQEQAELSLKKAIELKPAFPEALFLYGILLKSQNSLNKALVRFRGAVRYAPRNPRYQRELAICSQATGNPKTAVRAIGTALSLAPKDPETIRWAGLIYARTGYSARADSLLEKSLALDNNCPACHEALGRIAFAKGNLDRAIAHLQKAVGTDHNNDSALVLLGNAFLRSGDTRSASAAFEKAFAANPHNSEALYRICATRIEQGNIEQASQVLDNNKKLASSGWIHLAQARVNEAKGNSSAAVISYGAALKFIPGNADAHVGLGRSFLAQKKYRSAYTSFAKAVSVDPSNADALVGRGEAYFGLGKLSSAAADFMKAAAIQPRHERAYYLAGVSYNRLKQYSNAVGALRRAVVYHDKSAPIHYQLAVGLAGALLYKEAVDNYEKAAKLDEKEYGVTGYRSAGDIAHNKLKDNRAAKKYYSKFLDAGGKDTKIKKLVETL